MEYITTQWNRLSESAKEIIMVCSIVQVVSLAMMKKLLSIPWMMLDLLRYPPLAKAGKNTHTNTPLINLVLKKKRNGFSIAWRGTRNI